MRCKCHNEQVNGSQAPKLLWNIFISCWLLLLTEIISHGSEWSWIDRLNKGTAIFHHLPCLISSIVHPSRNLCCFSSICWTKCPLLLILMFLTNFPLGNNKKKKLIQNKMKNSNTASQLVAWLSRLIKWYVVTDEECQRATTIRISKKYQKNK